MITIVKTDAISIDDKYVNIWILTEMLAPWGLEYIYREICQ
jgi:hypothetical protein